MEWIMFYHDSSEILAMFFLNQSPIDDTQYSLIVDTYVLCSDNAEKTHNSLAAN